MINPFTASGNYFSLIFISILYCCFTKLMDFSDIEIFILHVSEVFAPNCLLVIV